VKDGLARLRFHFGIESSREVRGREGLLSAILLVRKFSEASLSF